MLSASAVIIHNQHARGGTTIDLGYGATERPRLRAAFASVAPGARQASATDSGFESTVRPQPRPAPILSAAPCRCRSCARSARATADPSTRAERRTGWTMKSEGQETRDTTAPRLTPPEIFLRRASVEDGVASAARASNHVQEDARCAPATAGTEAGRLASKRGLSLAKYRGAPPVPVLAQERHAISVT
jgi:hypothetical protein